MKMLCEMYPHRTKLVGSYAGSAARSSGPLPFMDGTHDNRLFTGLPQIKPFVLVEALCQPMSTTGGLFTKELVLSRPATCSYCCRTLKADVIYRMQQKCTSTARNNNPYHAEKVILVVNLQKQPFEALNSKLRTKQILRERKL